MYVYVYVDVYVCIYIHYYHILYIYVSIYTSSSIYRWLSHENLHLVPGFPAMFHYRRIRFFQRHLLPRRLVAAAWEAPHRGCPSGRTVASGTPTKNPRRRLTDSAPQWLLLGDRLGYDLGYDLESAKQTITCTPGHAAGDHCRYLYLPS